MVNGDGFLFETERLGLKPNDPSIDENVQSSLRLMQTQTAQRNMGISLDHVTVVEVKARMQARWDGMWLPYGLGSFSIYLKPEGDKQPHFIGKCSIVRDPSADYPDVGYSILEEEMGKGYTTEAVIGLIRHCREHNGIKDVTGFTKTTNGASRRVLEKLGMKHVATITMPFGGRDQEFVAYAQGEDAEGKDVEYWRLIMEERIGNFAKSVKKKEVVEPELIPGHHCVPVAYTAFAIWLPAFLGACSRVTPIDILSDEIEVVLKEPAEVNGEPVDDVKLIDGAEDGPLEELDVAETVTYRVKDPEVLWTLTWGVPSPSSWFWTLITALINLAVIAMFTDRLYRAQWFHQSHDLSFARVGYVSSSTADILIREPRPEELPIFVSMRLATPHEEASTQPIEPDTAFKAVGSIRTLGNDTDYTATVKIVQLRPDTRYQYLISNNRSGFFTTAPPIGKTPARSDGKFVFLHSSCLKPGFPYLAFQHALSLQGLRHLARWIPSLKAQFMLFLGDFIYIDVPWRFGTSPEAYRQEYRMVYSSPDWPAATKDLPWIHVYDDHEIANDWDNGTSGLYDSAYDAFNLYQSSVNPPNPRTGQAHNTYYAFVQGPATFFMLDTRRYRSHNNAPAAGKTMLGATQLADLLFWLRRVPERGVRWKFVISSVPFTKNWHMTNNDTWGAFLDERQQVLEAMWDCTAKGFGVVVLSGDRHEFAATRFSPPEGDAKGRSEVMEFSTSPLSMFYLPIRTYYQRDEEDVMVQYMPKGQSKFGAVEITAPAAEEPSLLNYRLFVDGREKWTHTLMSPQARPWSLQSLLNL